MFASYFIRLRMEGGNSNDHLSIHHPIELNQLIRHGFTVEVTYVFNATFSMDTMAQIHRLLSHPKMIIITSDQGLHIVLKVKM